MKRAVCLEGSSWGCISRGLWWLTWVRSCKRALGGWLTQPYPWPLPFPKNICIYFVGNIRRSGTLLACKVSCTVTIKVSCSKHFAASRGLPHIVSLDSGSGNTNPGCFSQLQRLTLEMSWDFPKVRQWAAKLKPEGCSRDPWESPPSFLYRF